MARRLVVALPVALACAAGAAAGTLGAEPALELTNTTRPRVTRIPLGANPSFSVTYHHSMYDAPVTEEFAVEPGPRGGLLLTAVSSPSAAVREYFGLTAAGERHLVSRALPEVVFRVATGTPQRLRAGGVDRSFLEFGAPGDRVLLRAVGRVRR